MEAKLIGNNVVIKIPIESLVNAFNMKEENRETFEVKYKRKFAQGVVDYLNDQRFQALLDEIFDLMIYEGKDYFRYLEEED